MVDIINLINIIKGKLIAPKRLTDLEGQNVVNEHYKTFAEVDKVEVSEIHRRETICSTCDNKEEYFSLELCKSCCCFIKLKAALKGATCPLDKW